MSQFRKRQKVEHVSSDDGEDASFASFSDDEEMEVIEKSSNTSQASNSAINTDGGSESDEDDSGTEENDTQTTPGTAQARSSKQIASVRREASLGGVSMFNAQISQLLQQIRPKHTARDVEAEKALHALKTTINSISPREPLSIKDARRTMQKEKITIPFPVPQPADSSNLKFAYAKPTSINVVGSYALKTASGARRCLYIDMVTQMPSSLFQEKDYLDHRYFHKRAFYVACMASSLRAAYTQDYTIQFESHHDDPLRPIIAIRPHAGKAEGERVARNWQINILPSIAGDVFSPNKIMPDRNCIRKGGPEGTATPAYNSSIRADMLVADYLRLLHKASTTCPAYKDACALGSTWLRQRGFRATSKKGGLASFEWSALIALLLHAGSPGGHALLNTRMDSVQMFKATLQLLATKDLIKQPLIIGSGKEIVSKSNALPVVWDVDRSHNIFYKVSVWSYRRLQTEAQITLTSLGDLNFDGFEAAFIIRKAFDLLDNDYVFELHAGWASKTDIYPEHYNKLYSVLRRGLGDRVKSINLNAERSKPWNIAFAQPQLENDAVKIGLTIKADTVNRTVDHGPSVADKTAAAEFREFWGDKAELRRFKDGSITEALIWDSSSRSTPVLEQVLSYLLHQHVNVDPAKDVTFASHSHTQLFDTPATQAIHTESFKTLEQDIRALEGLPLPIRQILLAESNQGDSAKSGLNHKISDIVMQFESSGRWPDNLAAIQRTKLAFLLKISELLLGSGKEVTARVGLENQDHDICNQGYLEVVYAAGSAFRIRIFHDREQTLLERQLKDKSLDSKSIEMTASALAMYKREYIKKPALAQAVTQLCARHAALSGTITALTKWLSSHVLANHFDHELVELLAAQTFVQPWPWQSPNSVQSGFLRTLAWLARWDWRFRPLIVDMSTSGKMKSPEIAAIRTRFDAWRKLDPAFNRVAIFAASNVDVDGATYSTDQPSKVVVSRLVALAKAAVMEIQSQGIKLDVRTLFSSSLLDYNFVIHLDPHHARGTTSRKRKDSGYKNLDLSAVVDASTVGYAPAADLLAELQILYGSAILFFSGWPERAAIGAVWTPQTADRTWKVNLTYSTAPIPSKDDSSVVARINKNAILAEIARLGGDLIERIEVPAMAQT